MSNTAKGMIAGLIATLALSVLMLLNGSLDLIPTINVIQLLMSLGTLSAPSAWMDHFIVGVVVWGLLFAIYDSATTRPAIWLKGIIFGMFAWLTMMVAFLPLAGAGFIGAKIGIMAAVGFLILHLIYGVVLGTTYGLLGVFVPVKGALVRKAEEKEILGRRPNPNTMNSADINDHLQTSSPSGRTVLIIVGCLTGFYALIVLAVEFRTTLGF